MISLRNIRYMIAHFFFKFLRGSPHGIWSSHRSAHSGNAGDIACEAGWGMGT